MSGKGLLNYTTTVPVARTLAQLQEELAKHGATAIAVNYADGKPTGLSFQISGPHGPRAFTLPVDVAAVQKVLGEQYEQRRITKANASPAQAERTAWRVLLQWVEVQMAMVRTRMVTLDQVMLAYMITDGRGTTLYQRYIEHGLRALEPGDE